jgi:hypothetical protein
MASFPSIPIGYASVLDYQDELVTERASSGTLRARSFWSAKKTDLRLRLRLTRVQTYGTSTTGLMAFFDAWKAGTSPFSTPHESFTITIDTVTYTVVFNEAPQVTFADYGVFDVGVRLAEV